MKDIQINTFEKGMQKDLGATVPQQGSYTHAENIRIVSDGDVGESAVVVSVNGNKQVVNLEYTYENLIQLTWDQPGAEEGGSQSEVTFSKTTPKIIGYVQLQNNLILFTVVEANDLSERGVIYKIDTSQFPTIDQYGSFSPVIDYEIIYESTDLNFSLEYPIQAVGRYETENIQRVYWTDNLNPVRTINILQENLLDLPVIELKLNIPVTFSSPEIEKVDFSGSLPAGMYQYAYRLKTKEGAITRFSPLSNFTHVVAGSQYWDYQEDPENQTEYSNTPVGEITDKAVILNIKQIDTDYDFIEIAAIYKIGDEAIENVYVIKEIKITGSQMRVTHRSDSGIPILLEEVTEITNIPDKVKTLVTKDNRLFLGGVQYSPFDLQFNARAYRYRRPDNVKYASKSIYETATQGSIGTYVDAAFDPISQTGNPFSLLNNPYTVEENMDAINPYNDISKLEVPAHRHYKYTKDGITLGGEGPNIKYEFFKKRLDGNQGTGNWDIPDEAPFISSTFAQEDDGNVAGDYKSPQNVSKFLGYRRGEVYRFGIVLYDLDGNPGFVNWIGDIRFPGHQDYDFKHTGGIYNYTLGQVSATDSGTNYNISSSSANAYQNMEYYDPNNSGGYDEITSSYNFEDNEYNEYVGGSLYALGIMFTVDIPDDIKPKISGYRIVRVERKEIDKTILGSGILNYGHNLYKVSSGGVAEYSGYATDLDGDLPVDEGLPLGYGAGGRDSRVVTIDSPDFAFSKNYPTSTENYLQVIGAVTGKIKHDFEGNNIGSATGYCSHTLALEEKHLFSTHSLSYSTKLDAGGNLDIPGHNVLEDAVENLGFSNKCFNNGTDRIVGIGEETLLIKLTDVNSGEPFSGASEYEELSGGIYSQYWIDEGLVQDDLYPYLGGFNFAQASDNANPGMLGRAKLLASIRTARPDQYGGNSYLARKNNVYIPAGPFISMDSELIDQYGRHEVWGGDTYVVLYDLEKIRRHDSGIDTGEGATGGRNQSLNYAFPIESSVNTTLRGGWHFANKKDWSTNSDTLLNTFDLDNCYSSENTTEAFIPKPDNFSEAINYGARVLYSDAKINAEQQDSWRKFRAEAFKDVDALYGDINKLIVNNDIMYYLQKTGFGKLSINPVSTVVDQEGASIVLGSGSVIQDSTYISTNIGCNNFLSAVSSPLGIYWFDSNTRKAYAFRANGLESISDTHGVKSWFNSMYQQTELVSDSAVLGYDYMNSEILFSLKGNIGNPESTIVFSEKINNFTSIYSYYTPMYIMLPNRLLSINPVTSHRGIIYEHNTGMIGEWYETSNDIKIEFIVNKNPLYPKAFDHIEWFASKNNTRSLYATLADNFNQATFRVSSPEQLVIEKFSDGFTLEKDTEFDIRENISRLPVPRNMFGERLRDTYIKIGLQSVDRTTQEKITLHYVKTLFRISRR